MQWQNSAIHAEQKSELKAHPTTSSNLDLRGWLLQRLHSIFALSNVTVDPAEHIGNTLLRRFCDVQLGWLTIRMSIGYSIFITLRATFDRNVQGFP